MPDAVQPEALVGMLGNYGMLAAYAGWTPTASDREVDLGPMLPTLDGFIARLGTPTDPMEAMFLRDLVGLRSQIAAGPMSSAEAHLLMQRWYLPLRAGEAPDALSVLAYVGNGLFEGLNLATEGRYGEAVFGSNELPSLDAAAQHQRMQEEAAGGSIGFWRALGRALWQGTSLGLGDEIIARWDALWQGTEFRDELARQRAIIGILQGANPGTFALGELAGGIATQVIGMGIAKGALPLLSLTARSGAAAHMVRAGAVSSATGAVSLVGAAENRDDWALRGLVGALISGPAAALGAGYLAAAWDKLSRPVRIVLSGILGGAPGAVVEPHISPESFFRN